MSAQANPRAVQFRRFCRRLRVDGFQRVQLFFFFGVLRIEQFHVIIHPFFPFIHSGRTVSKGILMLHQLNFPNVVLRQWYLQISNHSVLWHRDILHSNQKLFFSIHRNNFSEGIIAFHSKFNCCHGSCMKTFKWQRYHRFPFFYRNRTSQICYVGIDIHTHMLFFHDSRLLSSKKIFDIFTISYNKFHVKYW